MALSGQAVKWLDDLVDHSGADFFWEEEGDQPETRLSPTARAVYASACLCLSHWLDPNMSGAVFWNAYALGMIRKPLRSESFPGGPPEWVESAVAYGFAVGSGGLRLASGVGAGMVAAQAMDDFRDREMRESVRRLSAPSGSRWARQFLVLLALAAGGASLRLIPGWALILLLGSYLISPPRDRGEVTDS